MSRQDSEIHGASGSNLGWEQSVSKTQDISNQGQQQSGERAFIKCLLN